MRLALSIIAIFLAISLKSQQAYWLFSGRGFDIPEKGWTIGLNVRSFSSKDPVPDLRNQQADIPFALSIIEREVVMPAPPLQIGLKLQAWSNPRLAFGMEVIWDINRDRAYTSKAQNLKVVFPAKNELQELGWRFSLQSFTKLGTVHVKPLLIGGVMFRSEGYNFYMRQSLNEGDIIWQSISVDRTREFFEFDLFNLFFVGAGAEILLFAVPAEDHTHAVNLELMAQRYLHRKMNYWIDYENSAGDNFSGQTIQGGAWWTFSLGLNYSFF